MMMVVGELSALHAGKALEERVRAVATNAGDPIAIFYVDEDRAGRVAEAAERGVRSHLVTPCRVRLSHPDKLTVGLLCR